MRLCRSSAAAATRAVSWNQPRTGGHLAACPESSGMPQCFHLDRARLSMRELRQISRGLRGSVVAVLLKCGLIPSFSQHPLVRPESICRVPFEQFPIEARKDLQPAIDEAVGAGLRLQ